MPINFKIDEYEGPLDLLLNLIEKNKLNICDVPIAEITDQYLEAVRQMAEQNLDLASEFIVMAARLLNIKSKILLPKNEEESEEADDLKEKLERQLIEYKMYKMAAAEIKERMKEAIRYIYKDPSIPENIKLFRKKVDIFEIARKQGINSHMLTRYYVDALKRISFRKDPVRSEFGRIKSEPVDAGKRLAEIKTIMKKNNKLKFAQLLPKEENKAEKVVTLLILLEMMKTGTVSVSQNKLFGDIDITVEKDVDMFENISELRDARENSENN